MALLQRDMHFGVLTRVVRRGTNRRNDQLHDGGVGLRRVEPDRAAAGE